MADLRLDTAVPILPPELRNLFFYLLERDGSPPVESPVAIAITTTTTSGWDRDVIEWEHNFNRRPPDGFIVAISGSATELPSEMMLRVSAQARKHAAWWPTGHARSYAVAAFRNTYQGEKLTSYTMLSDWVIP